MALPPIPIQRYLVPDAPPAIPTVQAAPEGFTLVHEKITGGLPHAIQLDAETTVLVLVPTGLATTWRDTDPTALVATSETERTPSAAPSTPAPLPIDEMGDVTRVPARLLLRRNRTTDAAIPLTLTAGARRLSPDGGGTAGTRGARLEIVLLAWEILAGSLRGPGDFGSYVTFAWRRADRGSERFEPPPANVNVLTRRLSEPPAPELSEAQRDRTRLLESAVGVPFATPPEAFRIRRLAARAGSQ